MAVLNIILRIMYYFLPIIATFPCYIYALFLRKREVKRIGEEKYSSRLDKWAMFLLYVFIIEAVFMVYFSILYDKTEGIIGLFNLVLIFVARTICYTFIEGFKRGIMGKEKE